MKEFLQLYVNTKRDTLARQRVAFINLAFFCAFGRYIYQLITIFSPEFLFISIFYTRLPHFIPKLVRNFLVLFKIIFICFGGVTQNMGSKFAIRVKSDRVYLNHNSGETT